MYQNFNARLTHMENAVSKWSLTEDIYDYYKGREILVTGGAGAIGSNLVICLAQLVGPSGTIVILDNLSASKSMSSWNVPHLPNVLFVKGDIRDSQSLNRVFKRDISILFHLAAFFANQNSVDYPAESADVDVVGMTKLLDYSVIKKIERFVYASSGCAIYGSYAKLPLSEDFISMHLTTPYQINKMTGEMYCNFYNHHFGLKTVNCRFFNSFGPGEAPGQYRNVIPNFIYWAMSGLPLPITGDGNETRDFTSVYDLVQGLVKAGFNEAAVGENFNLAAGREISIKDMMDQVNAVCKNQTPPIFKARRKWDTKPRLLASIDKAKKLINYNPIENFEESLLKNMEWFSENWDLINKEADFAPGMNPALNN